MVATAVRHHPRHLVAPLQTTLDCVQSSSRLTIMTTIMMMEIKTLWNLEGSSFLEHLCFEEKLLASHFIQRGAGQHLKVRDSQNSPSLSIVSTSIQNAHEFGRSHQNHHHLSLMDRVSYLLVINCSNSPQCPKDLPQSYGSSRASHSDLIKFSVELRNCDLLTIIILKTSTSVLWTRLAIPNSS